ncbi:MAG: DUF1559 domain-containing protein [Planctomycetota bacterium]
MKYQQFLITVALSVWLATSHVRAGPGESLGWLPEDTMVSFRIDFKDLWRGPLGADTRRLVQKGGAAFALLQLQMSPRLDDIAEISGGAWVGPDGSPAFIIAMTSAQPVDGFKAAFSFLGPSARPGPGGTWEAGEFLMARPTGNELIFGTEAAVRAAIGRKKGVAKSEGLLEGQIAIRMDRHPVLEALAAAVPEPFGALAMAKSARLNLGTSGDKAEARLTVRYGTEKDAEKALEAVNEARKMAKPLFDQGRAQVRRELGQKAESDIASHFGMVMGLGWLNLMEKGIDAQKVEKKGLELATRAEIDIADLNGIGIGPLQAGIAVGMFLPAVQKVRDAASRTASMNNMKMLGLALHNYEASMGRFPPAVVTDKDGKPLYSWRVLILPYIEQDAVFRAWKMDEPWDGPNNRRLSKMVIKTFCEPSEPPSNRTRYRVFHGNGALFETSTVGAKKGTRINEILDGTSNTIMVVQTRESVPWAAPDEIAYDPKKPLPEFGLPGAGHFLAAYADGSVRSLKTTIKPQWLHQLIQKADGIPLPDDFDK